MYQGGTEYVGDAKNWQEFALGALTSLLGIPGKFWKGQWNGGAFQAFKDAKETNLANKSAADNLNTLVNSQEFQDRWRGYIRHLKYNNLMEDAVLNDDEYAWHTANDSQLISDIMTFAKAGKLEELNRIADEFSKVTIADADRLRSGVEQEKANGTEYTTDYSEDSMSDEEIVDAVKKRAVEIKNAIQQYKEVYDVLADRIPQDSEDNLLQELIFTAQQINSFEKRFLEMYGEVLNSVQDILEMQSSAAEDGKSETSAEARASLQQQLSLLEKIWGHPVSLDIDKNLQAQIDSNLNLLETIADKRDKKLGDKVRDMRKLVKNRQDFYYKMRHLQTPAGAEEFKEEAQTQEKMTQATEKEQANIDTQNLNTLNDVKKAYYEKRADEQADFLTTLETVEDTNPSVKAFLNLKRKYDSFLEWLAENPITSSDITVDPRMIQSTLNDLLRRARSEEDLTDLPDTVFIPQNQFNLNFQSPFGPTSPTAYASVKQAIREAMAKYLGKDVETESRKTLNPTPVEAKEKPGEAVTPTGQDAAQPASVEPAPVKGQEPKPAAKIEKSEPEQTPVAEAPTADSLSEDAAVAMEDTAPESVDEEKASDSDKIPFYRTSVPEVDTLAIKQARSAIELGNWAALQNLDLSDFVDKHPEYAEIWNALADRGAFTNVATLLEAGDTIHFVIDPTFPTYKGQPQILLTVNKGKEEHVLTVLSGQTSQYFGLRDLRDRILEEYNSFKEEHPNDKFVFNKTSQVWLKRSGAVDYDYSGSSDRGIVDIPEYSADAPIVFIDRHGNAVVINGGDKTIVHHVSSTFDDPETNRERGKIGNLYYMVKIDKDRYIPIRLNVEHFTEENKELDVPIFEKIRDNLTKISNIVSEANTANLAAQNEKLHNQLQELAKYLDIHDDFFKLDDYPEVGVALRYSSPTDSAGKLRRPDQMSAEWMIDFVAGLGRSLQIRQDARGRVPNIDEMIVTGLITSNARMLRPKGTDFYIYPWNEKTQDFAPKTSAQISAYEQMNPVSKSDDDFDFGDRDDLGMIDENPETTYTEQPVQPRKPATNDREEAAEAKPDETSADKASKRLFSDLPDSTRSELIKKGYTEETWNKMSEEFRDQVLTCISA